MEEARRSGVIEGVSGVTGALVDTVREGRHAYDRLTTALSGCAEAGERARRALALLCDGQPPARGHLFLFKEAGLALVASNVPSSVPPELVAFAQRYIESEMRVEGTETLAFATNSLEREVLTHHFQDTAGTRYSAVILAAPVGNCVEFAGVAVVSDGEEDYPFKVRPLADALARLLIESGDARGVRAA
jgi:hypothetical protein